MPSVTFLDRIAEIWTIPRRMEKLETLVYSRHGNGGGQESLHQVRNGDQPNRSAVQTPPEET